MSNSIIFGDNKTRKSLENKILEFLNSQKEFLSPRTINSPRAVGDALESLISDNFEKILGSYVGEYSASFARRAMADLAFTDKDGKYYVVDVKTHRLDTKFNMPNLVSVERLSRFYEEDNNYFVILKVDYEIDNEKIHIAKITFSPIESLNWSCLTIGALGWGQIQIANANKVDIDDSINRKKWMLELCNTLLEFYPKEIGKINERVEHFQKIKKRWASK